MKIALIGYGKMGKAIEKEAKHHSDTILVTIDSEADWNKKSGLLPQADVAIEFSMPSTAVKNIIRCFDAGVPVVVGTTGWEKDFEKIRRDCLNRGQTLFTASNFSIGMNIFFEINKQLASLMNRFEEFDVGIDETHHIHKLDAPSGTAKTLAGQIVNILDRKARWISGSDAATEHLDVVSHREGEVTGTHTVTYSSEMEEIKITHSAFNRAVFAKGALTAAHWVRDKKGVFTMSDLLLETQKRVK